MNMQNAHNQKKLCYYFNPSSQLQIITVKNLAKKHYERVVLPKQRLFFEAFPNSFLEVHRQTFTGTDLVDKISCQTLQVLNEDNVKGIDNLSTVQ